MGNDNVMKQRTLLFKIAVLGFVIIILSSFGASLQSQEEPLNIKAVPMAPKLGEPLSVTVSLSNPSDTSSDTHYALFANDQQVMSGIATLAPKESRKLKYIYNSLEPGDQVTFVAKTQSKGVESIKYFKVPPVPPNALSSFVSFATFATSVLSSSSATGSNSINSMAYYDKSFVSSNALNVGLVFSILLIVLLIYMELSEPLTRQQQGAMWNLRTRFSRLSSVLFIIFIGMVLTQIALIVGGIN